jgi:hypothetical protein
MQRECVEVRHRAQLRIVSQQEPRSRDERATRRLIGQDISDGNRELRTKQAHGQRMGASWRTPPAEIPARLSRVTGQRNVTWMRPLLPHTRSAGNGTACLRVQMKR